MRRKISEQERRHQDYLRRKSLKISRVCGVRLQRLRAEQVRQVLRRCRDYQKDEWAGVIMNGLNEPYLPGWYAQLYVSTGLPQVSSTVRDMNRAKAEDSGIWEGVLRSYATRRAGEAIVSVTGTFRDSLISILRSELADGESLGVEQITQRIYDRYRSIQEWEVRRIVQTETLVAVGQAGDAAARSLDVGFTKQWCTSGLVNTRDTHLAADGTVADEDEPFRVGDSLLMYPHDTSLGASASEIINCACSCIRRPK